MYIVIIYTRWEKVCDHINIDDKPDPCKFIWAILTILAHITLYIMFIVIYCKGDDLLDYFRVPIICIISSYSVTILLLILSIIALQIKSTPLGVVLLIAIIVNSLFGLGIAIWCIVLLNKNEGKSETFLRTVMIIYVSLEIEVTVENLVKNLLDRLSN